MATLTVAPPTITRLAAVVVFVICVGAGGAEAQPTGKVWHVAYLSLQCAPPSAMTGFDAAMKQLGYVEGRNLVMERRLLCQRLDAVTGAVQEVIRLNVDVIVTGAIRLSAAAKAATSAIPIVFVAVRAPVERGLVTSLARPGANITGLATFPVATIDSKLFQLVKELIPQLTRVAVLRSADDPPGAAAAQEHAARSLGFTLTAIPFSNATDLSNLPAAIHRSGPQALIVPDTSLAYARRKDIAQVAATKRLPAAYAFRETVEDGGLIAVSVDFEEMGHRTAVYVDKILKGAKPGDLPIEQPTKVEVAVNLKTAKALGLTIPPEVLLRADRVVE